jgi:hypothetical protein
MRKLFYFPVVVSAAGFDYLLGGKQFRAQPRDSKNTHAEQRAKHKQIRQQNHPEHKRDYCHTQEDEGGEAGEDGLHELKSFPNFLGAWWKTFRGIAQAVNTEILVNFNFLRL